MHKLEIVTRYGEDDTEFLEDYMEVVLKVNGKEVRVYGDGYHDRGMDKAVGFVDGFVAAAGANKVEVAHTKVADYPL